MYSTNDNRLCQTYFYLLLDLHLYLLHNAVHVVFVSHAGQLQVNGDLVADVRDGHHCLKKVAHLFSLCWHVLTVISKSDMHQLQAHVCDLKVKTLKHIFKK